MVYFRSHWSHLGHIDDHMPAPDGSCGIRTYDPWVLEVWPPTHCVIDTDYYKDEK